MIQDELTEKVIACAMRVQSMLGPGFLESVYQNALLLELQHAGIEARSGVRIPVYYRDELVGDFITDILVENQIELKATQEIHPVHETQLVNYLQATNLNTGLLLNFGAPSLQFKRKHRLYKPKSPHPANPVHPVKNAFSLIEVVLAIGVIAFALVGIMGLFPMALRSAQESHRETRATMIAQQIFSDLNVLTSTNRMLVRGPTASTPANVVTNFSLAANSSTNLAYDENGTGLTDIITDGNFAAPYPAATFLAKVTVDTNTGTPNLSRVQTTIETPAAAASPHRSRYTFVTLMNY